MLPGDRALFARVYEEQDASGAELEARLLDHLALHGVATPRPLPRRDGGGFTFPLANDGKGAERAARGPHAPASRPVALFPWCDGEII
jgi:homoserine kinase type II